MTSSRVTSSQKLSNQTESASAFRTDRSLIKTRRASHSRPQKKSRGATYLKRALVITLTVLLLFFGTVGGYAAWYLADLNKTFEIDPEKLSKIEDELKERVGNEPFYVLLLGSDSREGSAIPNISDNPDYGEGNERSDVMMLLRIDILNQLITVISIPRDTPIVYPDGSIGKINEAYNIGGAAYSIRVVSELTGVDISHYAEIHFSEFEKMIDSLGGIEINVPMQLSYQDALTGETITLQPGLQTLNGKQAQIFVRARHEYVSEQDEKRQSNNRILLEALIKKIVSKPVTELPDVIRTVASCIKTDVRSPELISLAFAFSLAKGRMTLYDGTGPSAGGIREDVGGLWLCYENPEGWAKLMAAVNAGEDPKSVNVESTAIIR